MATRFALPSPLKTAVFSAHSSTNITYRSFASVSSFHGRIHKDQKDLVHGEPKGPKIMSKTIPGPKTKAGLQHLDSLQDTRAATMMTGKEKEKEVRRMVQAQSNHWAAMEKPNANLSLYNFSFSACPSDPDLNKSIGNYVVDLDGNTVGSH